MKIPYALLLLSVMSLPAYAVTPSAVEGSWNVRDHFESNCPDAELKDFAEYTVNIKYNGSDMLVDSRGIAATNVRSSGDNIYFTVVYDEDGGKTTADVTLVFWPGATQNGVPVADGNTQWRWSDGNISCSGTGRLSLKMLSSSPATTTTTTNAAQTPNNSGDIDVYDINTAELYIPSVNVSGDYYSARLKNENSQFKLLPNSIKSAAFKSSNDTFDPETGEFSSAKVQAGSDVYQVKMRLNASGNFNLTNLTKVNASSAVGSGGTNTTNNNTNTNTNTTTSSTNAGSTGIKCFDDLAGSWRNSQIGGVWSFTGKTGKLVLDSINYGPEAQQITELAISSCENSKMTYTITRAALVWAGPYSYDKSPSNDKSQDWSKVYTQAYKLNGNQLQFGNYTYTKR